MLWAILLLSGIVSAVPQVAFPINSQVPPIARVDRDYHFRFSASTFTASSSSNLTYSLEGSPKWLSLRDSAREFHGTPHANDVGPTSFQLRASDADGSTTVPVTFIVSDEPSPALSINVTAGLESAGPCSDIDSLTLYENAPFHFALSTTSNSADADKAIYYATSIDRSPLPSWIFFDGDQIKFHGTTPHPGSAPQTYRFLLIASTVRGFEEWSAPFSLVVGMHRLAFDKIRQNAERDLQGGVTTPPLRSHLFLDGKPVSTSDIVDASANVPPSVSFDPRSLTIKGQRSNNYGSEIITVTVKDIYGDLATTYISLGQFAAPPSYNIPRARGTFISDAHVPTASPIETLHSDAAAATHVAKKTSLSPGDIAAAVVVPIIALILFILCAWLCRRRRRREKSQQDDDLPYIQENRISGPKVGSLPRLQLKYHNEYTNDGVSSNQALSSQFEDSSNDYSTHSSVARTSQEPSIGVVARLSTNRSYLNSSRRSKRYSVTSSLRRSRPRRNILSYLDHGPPSERRMTGIGHGRTDVGPPQLTDSAEIFGRKRRTQSTFITPSASSFGSVFPQAPMFRNQSLRRRLSKLGRGNTIRLVTGSDVTSSGVGTSEKEKGIKGETNATPELELQNFDIEKQKYLKSRVRTPSRPLFGSYDSSGSHRLKKSSTPRKGSVNSPSQARAGWGSAVKVPECTSSPSLLYPRVIDRSREALDRFNTPDSGSRYSDSTQMDYTEFEGDQGDSVIEEETQPGETEQREDECQFSGEGVGLHRRSHATGIIGEGGNMLRSKYTSGQSSTSRQSIFHEDLDDREDGRGSESPRML